MIERVLLAALLASCPALAQVPTTGTGKGAPSSGGSSIGTPILVLNEKNGGYTSGNTIATTADSPIGDLVVLVILPLDQGTDGVTSVTDSAGNTYHAAVQSTLTAGYNTYAIWYGTIAADLPSGGTITINTYNASVNTAFQMFKVTGTNGTLDKTNSTVNTGSNLSASLGTSALAVSGEISFAAIVTSAQPVAYSEGAGYTSTTNIATSVWYDFAYDITPSTASPTFAPSWTTNSTQYVAVIATFEP